jgi:hypothetical protein
LTRGDSAGSKWPLLLAVVLIAFAVASLAWPRFLASVRYLPVELAIRNYYVSGEMPSDRLPVLVRFATEAVEYQDHYRFHDGLSTLQVLRALDYKTRALERRPAYVSALGSAEQALLRAPAKPATWLRLASVRWILHEEPETIVDAWKMSIFTGRIHTDLLARRVELGLAHFAYLDEEGTAMLRDQLLLAWKLRPNQLMPIFNRRDRELQITRYMLTDVDPSTLSEIEAWIEARRR